LKELEFCEVVNKFLGKAIAALPKFTILPPAFGIVGFAGEKKCAVRKKAFDEPLRVRKVTHVLSKAAEAANEIEG
jgi:hypothetical protein